MPPPTRPSSDEPTAARSGRELLVRASAPRVAFAGEAVLAIAVSRAARRFVPAAALAAITHRAPHTSAWPASPVAPVPHVALAAWADVVLVCPASATTIARIANGDFSDLVSAIALTTRAPVILVPWMNPAMRAATAVVRNLPRCAEDGHL